MRGGLKVTVHLKFGFRSYHTLEKTSDVKRACMHGMSVEDLLQLVEQALRRQGTADTNFDYKIEPKDKALLVSECHLRFFLVLTNISTVFSEACSWRESSGNANYVTQH